MIKKLEDISEGIMAKKADNVGERALIAANEARSIEIKDNTDLEKANLVWDALTVRLKNLDEAYDDLINADYKKWKMSLAKKARYYNPVKEVRDLLKKRIADFKEKKELERKAEEARLYEQALKDAEERKKLEAEANPEQAEEILSEPVSIAPVVVPKDLPIGGPVLRTIWDAEVTDFAALITAVAEGKVNSLALLPNEKFLREQAKSFKGQLNIPGVRSYSRVV